MPFKARHPETNEIIDIRTLQNPRELYGNATFNCAKPDCDVCKFGVRSEGRNRLTGQIIRRAHFFRKDEENECQTTWSYSPESPQHIEAKEAIIGFLSKKEAYEGWEFDEEYYGLTEIKRIPDVFASNPLLKLREAHEVQLSPIPIDEFIRRTNDYLKADIQPYWYIGGKMADESVNILQRHGAVVYKINFETVNYEGQWETVR